ncbi:hypothetical protein Tco_1048955 [Tanacetum coccineum]
MEKVRNTSATLRSCLKGSQIRNIDGKIVGKDGKPMMPMRHETSNGGTVHEETVTVTKSLKDDTDRTFFEAWRSQVFRSLLNLKGEDADVVLPLAHIYCCSTKKVIKDEDGFFFFKFTSLSGLEQVLEQGLDAFTSTMCADPWGRMGYARALIEVSAEKELKQEVIMAVPEED